MSLLHPLADRLMRYTKIDTQADPASSSVPSSEKQKNLSRLLLSELQSMGCPDAELSEQGYVYATIPAAPGFEDLPVLCFCAHVDTAPDCSGTDVKPRLIKNYDGSDILYPDDPTLVLSSKEHPYLLERVGDDIITGSGLTLLGADDKAGVAIIMQLADYYFKNPGEPHGKIRILFTTDEEIGRGVDHVDMEKLGADFGYTLDGGIRGGLEGESFSADSMTITFSGVSAHPGYAKDKLVHAIKVAARFIDSLPVDLAPETTEGMQGFVHPVQMEGLLESASVTFILRDFITANLDKQAALLEELAGKAVRSYPGSSYTVKRKEQYRNMKEILDLHPDVMELARKAYKRAGLEPVEMSIRGGSDGSRLSFMGLPCPNIFTGEMAIHSRVEYCSVQDMEAAHRILIEMCAELCGK
jgi:tripeptide aminopeptidase